MKLKKIILFASIFVMGFFVSLFSADFTVSSFNCGGLSDHYDYIRAVTMHKLTQERYNCEPAQMADLEKIQQLALKILFSPNLLERKSAKLEWKARGYSALLKTLTLDPADSQSINKRWNEKCEKMVTTYKVRPIEITDPEVRALLQNQLNDVTKGQGIIFGPENPLNDWLDITRKVMAKRIFLHELCYDIIALQEADYLDGSLFPSNYAVRFSDSSHSINGIAWNKEKFELVEVVGTTLGRGLAIKLRDLESGKTVVIASCHLSGCNPFRAVIDPVTGQSDSAEGDRELEQIMEKLQDVKADIKIVAMDSNVTATHPRLSLLKKAGYTLDYNNYLDPTCTNPHQVLNTRIDWISVKSIEIPVTVHNIPVLGVGLNSPQTNISDHKPVAARISY